MTPSAPTTWHRAEAVAFTDDGTRVVALRLDEPSARPCLLEGAAATIWRALDRSCTAAEVITALTAGPSG
ncbi:MAG TPA: hypothetical protein VH915_00365, partial [Pedococcus sp.]